MRPPERRIPSGAIGLFLSLLACSTGWAEANLVGALTQQESSRKRTNRLQARPETARIRSRNYTVPRIDFNNSTVAECIEFLRQASREMDIIEPDPAKRGVAFVILLDPDTLQRTARINFQGENIPILGILEEIVRQAHLAYRSANFAIELGDPSDFENSLPQRSFDVPPAVFPECHSVFRKGSELAQYDRCDVRQRIKEWGLELPSKGTAYYFPATYELSVIGDRELLESVDEKIKSFVARHPLPRRKQTADSGIPGDSAKFGVRPAGRMIATLAKLQRIVFPRVEMRSATVEEAFGFFFRKTSELDTTGLTEPTRGIRGLLAPGVASSGKQPEITLSLVNIPARDALDYITKLAKLEYTVQEDGSLLIYNHANAPRLKKRTYHVPTEGIHLPTGTITGPDGVTYPSVEELFAAFDVPFPDGASADLTDDAEIVIQNTDRNLAVADVIVAALIDSREKKLSLQQLAALRSIIADAQAHGQIRPAPTLGSGEG